MHDTWKYWYEEHPTAEAQRQWLLRLQCAFSPSCAPVVVCREVNTERLRLPEAILTYQLPVNHRVILANEIVIECDRPNFEDNLFLTFKICERLKQDGVPFLSAHSGNKSFHIHILLDYRNITFGADIAGIIAANTDILRLFRNYVFSLKFKPWLANLDKRYNAMVDGSVFNKNHLIREFGGVNEKTKKKKTAVVVDFERKEIRVPDCVMYPDVVEFYSYEGIQKDFNYFIENRLFEQQRKLGNWFKDFSTRG